MVAPLLLSGGAIPDPVRLIAALTAVAVAYRKRNVVWGMFAGIAVFYAGLFATGAL
jgi:branched-subunit amino acid transport protein